MSSEPSRDPSSQPTPPALLHPPSSNHQPRDATPILNNLLSSKPVNSPYLSDSTSSNPKLLSDAQSLSSSMLAQPREGNIHSPQPSPAQSISDGAKAEQERYGSVPSSSTGPGVQFGIRKPPSMLPPGHQWPPQQGPDGMPYPGPTDPNQPPSQVPPGYGPPHQGMYPGQHPYWQQQPRYQLPPGYGPPPPHQMISPQMPYGVPTNPAYGAPTGPPLHMIPGHQRPPLPGQPGALQDWPKTNGQAPTSTAHPGFPQGYAQGPPPGQPPTYQLQPSPYFQQRKEGTSTPSQPPPPSIQSPSTASQHADDSRDDVNSMRSSPSIPQTPATGQRTPHVQHPGTSSTPSSTQAHHSGAPKLTRAEILERLVNEPAPIPNEMIAARREFFDGLLTINENNPEPLTGPPQVSKSVIDLHRLYLAVKEKGGFEVVTREKAWKNMCQKVNPTMSESSAAGYQLRRHYERHLLQLECKETGANEQGLREFAEKSKKKKPPKPEKDPNAPDKKAEKAAQKALEKAQKEAAKHGGPPPTAAGQPPTQGAPQQPPGYPNMPPGAPPPYGQPGPSYPGHPGEPNAFHPGYPYGPPPGQHHPGWMQPPQHGYPPGAYPPPGSMHRMPGHPGVRPPGDPLYDERQHPYYPPGGQPPYPPPPGAQHPGQPPSSSAGQPPHSGYPPYSMPSHSQASTPYSAPSSMPLGSKPDRPPSTIPVPRPTSRAPSTGPPPTGTPDSSSRVSTSGQDDSQTQTRPSSQQPLYSAPTPTSSYPSSANAPTPPMTTQPGPGPMGQPPPASGNYYPSPYGMPARPGMPPTCPPTSQAGMKPPYGGYPDMQGGYPPHGPPGMYPHHPGMWQPGQPRYPGYMSGPPGGPIPARTQSPADYNRPPQPQYSVKQPPYFGTPPGSQPPAASPGSNQRLRNHLTAPPMTTSGSSNPPSSSSSQHREPFSKTPFGANQPPHHAGLGVPSGPPQLGPNQPPGPSFTPSHGLIHGPGGFGSNALMQFPSGSIEATSSTQIRRRKKQTVKDLIWVTPKRLTMALRSGLEMETVWAINALNVILYDDTTAPFNLNSAPEILDLVVEHLRTVLELIFPATFEASDVIEDFKASFEEPADEKELEFWNLSMNEDDKTHMKQQIMRAGGVKSNFTNKTITGRKVHVEKKQMSVTLKKFRPAGFKVDEYIIRGLPTADQVKKELPKGKGTGMANRLYENLYAKLRAKKELPKPKFSHDLKIVKQEPKEEVKEEPKSEDQMKMTEFLSDSSCLIDLTNRCLSLSNIIRGFSFIPGNESLLSKHKGMLYLIGRFLRLMEESETLAEPSAKQIAILLSVDDVKKENEDPNTSSKPPSRSESAMSTRTNEATVQRLGYNPDKKPKGTTVASEENNNLKQLQEAANQLREDAFTILAHISVQLDLNEFDNDIAWPIFDGLLNWGVSKSLQAKDPLHLGLLSPRAFVLETLCKMSVLDTNVDLLLSTGPWSRMEEFIKVLCGLISLAEEVQNREFAIVILNAMCIASEPACLVAALQTPVVRNLVSFIEMADSNMHQIVTQQGIQVLRENSELMGTSVSMLRRAAQTLLQIARHEVCRGEFHKLQSQLLQFTISHFMDSRVAGYITEVLFELQKPPSENTTPNENEEEEKPTMPKVIDFPDEIIPNAPQTPMSDAFDPANHDDATMDAVNGSMIEAESNGTGKKRKNSDQSSYKADSEQSNHEMENFDERPPTKKSASAEVKEKLRNNILKHEAEQQFHQHAEDFHKNSLINGIHKMNGGTESNTLRVNDLRKSSDGNASTNSSTTAPSPGSMTVVA